MSYPENRQRNRILDRLSDSDIALLQPSLRSVSLRFRMRLQSSQCAINTIYFLESGLGSVVATCAPGARAEVALVGREGMTGLPVLHGADRSPFEIFMQIEGSGQQIAIQDLRSAMVRSPTLRDCLLLYAHAFSIQSGLTALANSEGKIEDRLARWLLMAQDRVEADELLLTHDLSVVDAGRAQSGRDHCAASPRT